MCVFVCIMIINLIFDDSLFRWYECKMKSRLHAKRTCKDFFFCITENLILMHDVRYVICTGHLVMIFRINSITQS